MPAQDDDDMDLRAQSSIEFLFCTALAMSMLVVAMLIYYQGQGESAALGQHVESQRICHEVAMQISAAVSAGSGTEAAFLRPQAEQDYSLFVSAGDREVMVALGGQTAFCSLATSNVSNGTSQSFYIAGDTTIRNVEGGVVIG
jgi:DNA-binding FrmR family transcriptional regulator